MSEVEEYEEGGQDGNGGDSADLEGVVLLLLRMRGPEEEGDMFG